MRLLKRIIKIILFLASPFIFLGLILSLLLYFGSDEFDKVRWFGGKKSDHFDVREEGFMYPTFSWCDDEKANGLENCQKTVEKDEGVKSQIPILFKKEEKFTPERGMIVRVKDPKNNWFIFGRIVALPNETIKLNGGYVYINNAPINEPYVWKRGVTYGNSNLNNCKELKLGKNQVFVMGDNRILSKYFDSRGKLGTVFVDNITHYLPLKYQKIYEKRWSELGNKEIKKINFSNQELTKKFEDVINKIRSKKGLSPIEGSNILINAAQLRAKNIVKNRDYNYQKFSDELTLSNAFSLGGEIFETLIQGYYDEESYEAFIKNYPVFLKENLKKIGVAYDKDEIDNCEHSVTIIYTHYP